MSLKYYRLLVAVSFFMCLGGSIFALSSPLNNIGSEYVSKKDKNETHIVVKGETLYSLSQKYKTTVSDIYNANPKSVEGIKIGDVLVIPTTASSAQKSSSANRTYTAKPKETLYSIAKGYGVKVDDIIEANPELRNRPLAEGQTLVIPSESSSKSKLPVKQDPSKSQFINHKVASRETLYSISRQYNVTPEIISSYNPDLGNSLREGTILRIPIFETSSGKSTLMDNTDKLSIGVVLPFVNKSNGQSARFIEYYEGFLLALSEMKSKGLSANIYTFDMGSEDGTDKLKSLLETYEMKSLDLIIGGVSPEQVSMISSFAKKEGIKYVVPFPTRSNDAFNNPQVFQVNAPHSILYSNVARRIVNLFPNANIIYITENGDKGDKSEFIDALNIELSRSGMMATSVDINRTSQNSLASVVDPIRKNLIIPVSASSGMIQNLLPMLNTITSIQPGLNISMLGHPDWQTYSQYFKDYGNYDTYIYTPFYLDEGSYRLQQFESNYKKWYNGKSLVNTYPRYGILGYDTGISFLTALLKQGENFDSDINSLTVSTLQTPFLFKKEGALNGYVNNGFYLIHYKADGSIDKIEYGR